MNRYIVTFKPVNSDSTDEYDVAFNLKSDNIEDIRKKAYEIARESIDSYSLRNHWEICEIEIF